MLREKLEILSFKKYPFDLYNYLENKYGHLTAKKFEIRETWLLDDPCSNIVKKYVLIADTVDDMVEYLKDKIEFNFYMI